MKRFGILLLLSLGALAVFLLTVVWYTASYRTYNASPAGMMGQMMGNQSAYGMMAPMPSYVFAILVALIVTIAGGIVGFGYYLAFPEIKTVATPQQPLTTKAETDSPRMDWSVLLRTSKPEEKRVLEVIESHGGKYLQKFIVKESGLSRLKTHRIISRFAERGIVTVTRRGNTNEVSLSSWLKTDAQPTKGSNA